MNDEDRAALVEAMRAERKRHKWSSIAGVNGGGCTCGEWVVPESGPWRDCAAWERHVEDAVFTAQLAVCRPVPCPECDGGGLQAGGWPNRFGGKQGTTCPSCHGSGSVPGPSPLLMVRGEQVGAVVVSVDEEGSPDYWVMTSVDDLRETLRQGFPVVPVFVDAGVSVPTPATCPECGGDGLDGSHDAALYYAERGDITYCDACNGSGSVPTPEPVCATCGGPIAYSTTYGVWDHKNPADRAGVGYGHDPVPTPQGGSMSAPNEWRVVDKNGDQAVGSVIYAKRGFAETDAANLADRYPTMAPFTIQQRTVSDWASASTGEEETR